MLINFAIFLCCAPLCLSSDLNVGRQSGFFKQSSEVYSPSSFSSNVSAALISGKPMVDVVKTLIAEEEIPVLGRYESGVQLKDVVIKDITSETAGRARQSIILIGVKQQTVDGLVAELEDKQTDEAAKKALQHISKKQSDPEQVKWLYVFKETSDSQETLGVHDAYHMMKSPEIKKNGYKMGFAWHEKLWEASDGERTRCFELLHAAKGIVLESLVKNFYDFKVCGQIIDDTVFDRKNHRFIDDMNQSEELYKKFRDLKKEVKKENNHFKLDAQTNDLIDYFKCKSDLTKNESALKDFVNQYSIGIDRCYAVKFSPDGSLVCDFDAIPQLKEAYNAFGSVLGKYLKPLQSGVHPIENGKIFDMPAFDYHPNNVFYDAASKTITLIDLQRTGDYLRSVQSGKPETNNLAVLHCAMHTAISVSFFGCFGHQYQLGSNQFFKNGVYFFAPDYQSDSILRDKLIVERDKLFHAIREIQEAFIDGFASNWPDLQDQNLLKNYFNKRWIIPYNSADKFFVDPSNPFVFLLY